MRGARYADGMRAGRTRLRWAIAITALLLATACSGSRPAEPTPTPSASVAATAEPTHPHENKLGLFVADVGDGSVRQLWDGEAVLPHWSPDGRSIAFWGAGIEGAGDWVIDLPTGSARSVGSGGGLISWSPDGSQLLVRQRVTSGTGHLALVDASTGRLRALAIDGLYAEWGPDGQRITFSGSTCEESQQRSIYDVRTEAVTLAVADHREWSAYISPNWSQVAYFKGRVFYAEQPLAETTLYVADLGGSGERPVFTPPTGVRPSAPIWSPDGKWIVYNVLDGGGAYLVRVDVSRDPVTLVAPDQFGWAGEWSPDSTKLIVSLDQRESVFDVRDGTSRQLNGWGGRWSPDGVRIAYRSGSGDRPDVMIDDLASETRIRVAVDPSVLAAMVEWSPDGRSIAFVGAKPIDYGPCI